MDPAHPTLPSQLRDAGYAQSRCWVDEPGAFAVFVATTMKKRTAPQAQAPVPAADPTAVVESQGGTVGADFPAEGGSSFWFELPAR